MEARFLLWLYLLSAGVSIHLWFRRRDVFPVSYLVALLVTAGAAAAGLFFRPRRTADEWIPVAAFWVSTGGFLLFLLLPVGLLRLARGAAKRGRFRAAARILEAARILLPASFLLPERDVYRRAASFPEGPERELLRRRIAAASPAPVGVRRAPASHGLALSFVALWVATVVVGGPAEFPTLLARGASYGPAIAHGEYYRLFSAMFLHAGILHLGMNLIAILLIGKWIEPDLGPARTLVIFFLGGLAGGLVSILYFAMTVGPQPSVGASGGVMALFGAALVVLLRQPATPLRARRLPSLVLMIGATIFLGLVEPAVDNGAHLGGLAAGALLALSLTGRRRWPDRAVAPLALLLVAAAASSLVWMLSTLP